MVQAAYETIYLGRDNSIDLILTIAGVPADLSSVTKFLAVINGVTVTSTDPVAGTIRWAQAGYATGEVRLFLGATVGLVASPSLTIAVLISYDPANPDGAVWGSFPVLIEAV